MRSPAPAPLLAAALSAALAAFLAAAGARADGEPTPAAAEPEAACFEMKDLLEKRAASGRRYLEFVRVEALSAGVYELPKGGVDGQPVHDEDEIYYVTAGRAKFTSGAPGAEKTIDARAGSVIYVKRGVPHRFVDIEEDLAVLVVFASGK
jgi:quercetin dioxygenase-like cupin family protein